MAKKSSTHQILSHLFLLSVAALLFHLPTISSVDPSNPNPNDTDFIRTSCGVTLYPDLCYTSLSRYANTIQQDPAKLARVAVSVSLSTTRHMVSYISNLSRQPNSGTEPTTAAALHDCFSTFSSAANQIKRSLKEMSRISPGQSFRFQMSNVQTWMSAALTNDETCTDGFDEVSDGPMKSDVCDRASNVKKFTSNGLALVNNYVAKGTNT